MHAWWISLVLRFSALKAPMRQSRTIMAVQTISKLKNTAKAALKTVFISNTESNQKLGTGLL